MKQEPSVPTRSSALSRFIQWVAGINILYFTFMLGFYSHYWEPHTWRIDYARHAPDVRLWVTTVGGVGLLLCQWASALGAHISAP